MRKIILIILLLSSTKTVACECICYYGDLFNNFKKHEVVFSAKVIEVDSLYGKPKRFSENIKLDIKKVYKGNPPTILKIKRGYCWTPNPKLNDEWIFFVSKNTNGVFEITPCNPSKKIIKGNFLDEQIKIVSKKVKKKLKAPTLMRQRKKYLIDSLKKINPEFVKNDFGFYLIKFNNDKSIKKIEVLNSLGNEADLVIKEFYKSLEYWNFQDHKKRRLPFKPNTITSITIYKNEFIK